jgi:pyruvate,water dikinase
MGVPAMLVNKNSTESFARKEAGIKGFQLYALTRNSLPVTPWTIIGTSICKQFKSNARIDQTISNSLSFIQNNAASLNLMEKIATGIQEQILSADLSIDCMKELNDTLDTIKTPVASISISYDNETLPYETLLKYDTFITNLEDRNSFYQNIKKCWASIYSSAIISTMLKSEIKLTPSIFNVALIVQEFTNVQKSGLIFTCDPVSKDSSKIIIHAGFGANINSISAHFEADSYVIEKNNNQIQLIDIVNKTNYITVNSTTGIQSVNTLSRLCRTHPCLPNQEIKELAQFGINIEKLLNLPQKVSWVWSEESGFKFTYSTPLHHLSANYSDKVHLWDSATMAEKYNNSSLPLSFSFLNVISSKTISLLNAFFKIPGSKDIISSLPAGFMFSSICGKVYFNILNWLRLSVALIPGKKLPLYLISSLIGIPFEDLKPIKEKTITQKNASGISILLCKLHFIFKLVILNTTNKYITQKFIKKFDNKIKPFRAAKYLQMSSNDTYNSFTQLTATFNKWDIPVINEFNYLLHITILRYFEEKWSTKGGCSEQLELLPEMQSESVTELIALAKKIKMDSTLFALVDSTPAEDCYEKLHQGTLTGIIKNIDEYIEKFGHCCATGITLEQKDLHIDSSILFSFIKNYLKMNLIQNDLKETSVLKKNSTSIGNSLSGYKKWIYTILLNRTIQIQKYNYLTRDCQDKLLSTIKAMFYGIGADYTRRGIMSCSEDLFYLEYSELISTLNGTIVSNDLQALIDLRKSQFQMYQSMEPPSRIITHGPIFWINNIKNKAHRSIPVTRSEQTYKGLSLSPGVVEERIRIAGSAKQLSPMNGEILVIEKADPSYISYYPTISGLIIEKYDYYSYSVQVAKEMGIPIIAGVNDITKKLTNNTKIRLDGRIGLIRTLNDTQIIKADPPEQSNNYVEMPESKLFAKYN